MTPRLCVPCGLAPSSRRGEHVLPQWHFRDLGPGPGPMGWTRNDEAITDRDGRPIRLAERVRVLTDCCERCNGVLERRFERPAKEPIRRIFSSRGETTLSAEEVEPVGLWFLKTLLLYAHPQTRHSDQKVNEEALRWDPAEVPDHRFYRWMTDGEAPPPGMSVWLFRADELDPEPPGPHYRVPRPTIDADGERLDFVTFMVTFHGINVTLVVHPGWPIEHPLESDATAVRLWPVAPRPLDLVGLPVLSYRSVMWLRCRVSLNDGFLGSSSLPALRHSALPAAVLLDVLPLCKSWGL